MRAPTIREGLPSRRESRRPGRRAAYRSLAAWAFALVAGACGTASADTFDPSFQRLVLSPGMGGTADPSSMANAQAGALTAYRTVVSELSAALAPKFLSPSDTIGYSGFQFDVEYGFTTISNQQCSDANAAMHKADCPWQYAVEGGQNGAKVPGVINTLTVMARKGIWLPLPSFEIGAGATKVLNSDLFAVQVYGKFALHEGFHGWPIPSLAVRGSGLRVMGAPQIDLTMVQIDASVSKSFGIAGSVTLVPYFGAAWLYSLPRGQVLDLTPNVDSYVQQAKSGDSRDLDNNAVFPSGSGTANDNITRWRFFGGARINYSVLVLTAEFVGTMCGDFNGGCKPEPVQGQNAYSGPVSNSRHPQNGVADNAATQYTFDVSAGFLF